MNNRVRMGWATFGPALLVAILLGGCTEPPPTAVKVGDKVPAMSIDALEGRALDSAEWRGRTVVLNIWATWCPPCRAEMPALDRLSRSLDPAGHLVVGLSLDKDSNLVREFARRYSVSFPLAVDPDGQTATRLLGTRVLPDTLIIAPDGRLADRVEGSAEWDSDAMRQRVVAARHKPGGSLRRTSTTDKRL